MFAFGGRIVSYVFVIAVNSRILTFWSPAVHAITNYNNQVGFTTTACRFPFIMYHSRLGFPMKHVDHEDDKDDEKVYYHCSAHDTYPQEHVLLPCFWELEHKLGARR